MPIFTCRNRVSLLDTHVRHLSIFSLAYIELGLLILLVLMVTDGIVAILNNSWSLIRAPNILRSIRCFVIESIGNEKAILKPLLIVSITASRIVIIYHHRRRVSLLIIIILWNNFCSATGMHIISPSLRHVLRLSLILRIQELHWGDCVIPLVGSVWAIHVAKVSAFLKIGLGHAVYFVFVVYWAKSVELCCWGSSISREWSWCLSWVFWDIFWLIYH